MSGREAILGNIRKGLKRSGPLAGTALELCQTRLREHRPNLIPARAQLPHAGQVELFVQMAQEASATVARVTDRAAVPAEVARYLADIGFAAEAIVAPDASIAGLDWAAAGVVTEARHARNGDRATVAPAFAGIAETGTLMLLAGPQSPTTLNFLPDAHIVVLDAARIVGPYEDAWAMLRSERGEGWMPRVVNWITGPSRSADIEQKLQMGAHGPIRLHIVLIGD